MCERTRFHYRKKSVFLNDSASAFTMIQSSVDKSFNGFALFATIGVLKSFSSCNSCSIDSSSCFRW